MRNRALPWIIGAALVIGGGALVASTPDDDAVVAPIEKRGAIDETVSSRALVAAAVDVRFARTVETDDGWSAEGNWLVVSVRASAPQTEIDASIRLASLAIGDRVFHASERPSASLVGAPLRVGIDTVGMLAFELPADVDSGWAELRLTPDYYTAELDDLVVITLRLDGIQRADAVEILPSELVAP
ncbi:hypothetical protein [Microbacterium hydrocarbonoxydans]|uniref:hypothetical protein n=1 Tax=Microbacterium hydrocarbonoxydans TaxID=273678 RepID=UPI00203BF20F|nr:hypothetical protein [Microbacterium hydrocarbonoxydans]MCM3779747.1 hypothetical protein [Microbacterium hydrocarbonoxydans]